MNRPSDTPALEVLSHLPKKPKPSPPLLFVHGAYCGAWCWNEHFLPWFAERGFSAHALSLSGHGNSPGRERLDSLSIRQYVNDVESVVATLPAPPILIGHSMGGFVVQKYLEQHVLPGAALMCSVPPQGLMASVFSVLFSHPGLFQDLNGLMAGGQASLESLRDALFAQEVSPDDMLRYLALSQPESHRALWDMMMFDLPWVSRIKGTPLTVMGAAFDHLIPTGAVTLTAQAYGVDAHIFEGMGHGLMMEKDWPLVAEYLENWILEIAP